MSYIASERIHELGVRIVLGATGRISCASCWQSGARLVVDRRAYRVDGAAALGARLLASLLFGVSPLDPASTRRPRS